MGLLEYVWSSSTGRRTHHDKRFPSQTEAEKWVREQNASQRLRLSAIGAPQIVEWKWTPFRRRS